MDIVSNGTLCKQLPEKVKNSIRSSINIVSVVDCVEELVLNSLDAQATSITINVDLTNFRIKVDDNGIGIAPEDLKLIGARYTTSKCSSVEDLQNLRFYGYRGEALASIVQLSTLVEVFTRQEVTVYSRKLKEDNSGFVVKGNLAKKTSKGTTIVVTGFLSKAVVRQKRIHPAIELEEIKSSIEAIALIHPRVAFILTDDEKSTKLLSIGSCISTKDVFRQLYGCKYGVGAHKLLEVSGQHDVFFFTVFVSSKLCPQKSYQHFYVNKRLVGRCQYNRTLNDALRELMDGSSNGNETNQEERRGVGRTSEVNKNKYPIFIVNIQCPVSEYDITFEPRKKLVEFKRKKVMEDVIETIICRCKAAINSDNRLEENSIIEKKSKAGKRNSSILGKSITTYAIKRAVHSRVVQRKSDQIDGRNNNSLHGNLDETVYSEINQSADIPSNSPSASSVTTQRSIISEEEDSRLSRLGSPTPKSSKISCSSFIIGRNRLNQNETSRANVRFRSEYKTLGGNMKDSSESEDEEEVLPPLPENYLLGIVNSQLRNTKPKVEITTPGSKLRQFVKRLPKLLPVEKHQESLSMKTPANSYQRTPVQNQVIRHLANIPYVTVDQPINEHATETNPVEPEPFIKSVEPIPYISDLPDDNDIQIVEEPSTINYPEDYNPFDEEGQDEQYNDILPPWANFDLCQFLTDSKGIKWMETPDPENGLFIYTSMYQKNQDKIVSKQKLTPQQLALLNMNQKPAFARPHFSFQKDYLEQNERRTLTKEGKLNLIEEGKSLFNSNVIEVLNGYAEFTNIKWRNPEQLENSTTIEESEDDRFFVSEYWQRPNSTAQLPLASLGTTDLNCTSNSKHLNNFVFKKEDLSNLNVIAQVDNKFIIGSVTVVREKEEDILVMFDQHGAHERVRLEMFTKDVYEPDNNGVEGLKQKRIARVVVKPPILLHFSPTEISVLKSFRNELEMVGISVEMCEDAGSVNVTNIPKCFAEKISTEKNSTRDETILKLTNNLIQEQLSYLLDTKQPRTTLPKTIHELLCSQACHGAIKFGDHLTVEACKDLIKSLAQCQTPFQCAHGRPIVFPLCNLDVQMSETCSKPT